MRLVSLPCVALAVACGDPETVTVTETHTVTNPVLSDCTDGDLLVRPCGNCGTQTATCEGKAWSAFGSCTDEGECAPGSVELADCGVDAGECVLGEQERACTATCAWEEWTVCTGSVEPLGEVCADGLDQDCDGTVDDGCDCLPAAPGAPGTIPVFGNITKMVADPIACQLYAISDSPTPELIVYDVALKTELARVALPRLATDLDVSPSGAWIAVSHGTDERISVIDPVLLTATTWPTTSAAQFVEVRDDGMGVYVEEDQWCDAYVIDLTTGVDTWVGFLGYQPDLELDPTGTILYTGESGTTGDSVSSWDVSGGPATLLADSDSVFYFGGQWVVVPPGGQHGYYGNYQFDPADVTFIQGYVGEQVFAGDAAGTFVVGASRLIDAETLRPIADHGADAVAGALVGADHEVWLYDGSTGDITYTNVDDWIGGQVLGDRNPLPGLLTDYWFDQVVHDPVQDQLYALDVGKQAVVFVDPVTLTPTHEVTVGSTPSDLSVDPTGTTLYVGHLETMAVAEIDIATGTFTGWIRTPTLPYEVVALADGYLAVIDEDQWTTLSVLDDVGAVVASVGFVYQGGLATTADGASLFVGESGISTTNLVRYALLGGALVEVDRTSFGSSATRRVVPLADGTGVFYDATGRYLDGANLGVQQYELGDEAISVTPDARLVMTEDRVYDLATGEPLGTLPGAPLAVQAPNPASTTLYVAKGGQLQVIDLTVY